MESCHFISHLLILLIKILRVNYITFIEDVQTNKEISIPRPVCPDIPIVTSQRTASQICNIRPNPVAGV